MAKRIVDEEMRFSIVINGNEAQKELYDLEKSTRDLTASNKALKAERAKLQAQGKRGTEEYKRLSAEIKQNSTTIEANRTRMSALQKEIGVTGLTMSQLRKKASVLRLQLQNMVPGSAQYKKLQADLQAVNTRLAQLRTGAKATEASLSKLATGVNKYFALGASAMATVTGVVLSLQKVIDYNSKLSDSLADVRKTTGLTADEVDQLTKSFGAFNTRTTRMELLKLAEDAGRLGITGVENLKAYTEQANKLRVALKDDLSETQIMEIGKMVNIYKVGEATSKDFAGSMDALGSAINEVSASGANQAGYLVEYLKRQAGIAAQARISAADNVGYAATFDEIGQSVEISATMMNKVFIDMFENTSEYAKIAEMDIKSFSTLLNTDANEAMLRFLEGLSGNNEGLQVMVKKIEDLEAGGTRGVQALTALAGSTDLIRRRQEESNKALNEATSLTDEYNLKNNNLAAILEKVNRRMQAFISNDALVGFLTKSAKSFAKLIGVTVDLNEAFDKNIKTMSSNIRQNRILANESEILLKRYEELTENGVEPTTTAKEELDIITLQLKDRLGDSVIEIDKETNSFILNTEQVRKQIQVKRLAADQEASTLASRLVGVEQELESLNSRKELAQREFELRKKHYNTLSKQQEGEILRMNELSMEQRLRMIRNLQGNKEMVKAEEQLNKIQKEINENLKREENIRKALKDNFFDPDNAKELITGGSDGPKEGDRQLIDGVWHVYRNGKWEPMNIVTPGNRNKDAERQARERRKLIEQLNKDILASERAAQDAKLELLEDSYLEELAKMHLAHERKMETLRSQILTETELQKLPLELRKKYAERNEATNKQIETETQAHNFRQAALVQKGLAQQFKEQEDKYQREKTLRQTKFAEEMAAYAGNEQAQKELRELHQKEELEAEAKHLEELIRQFNQMMAEGEFGGFDLELLTPAQKEHMEQILEDLRLKLAEVAEEKSKLSKGDPDGLDLGMGGELDILGFSAQDWVDAFENLDTIEGKIQAAAMAVQGFMNAWAMYHEYVSSQENKRLKEFERNQNREKTKLKSNLDNKFISQRQYDKAVEALEAEMDKRKAELEYKQAKRAWQMQLTQAFANTALGVTQALAGSPPPANFILAAIVGALGAVQIGMVAKNKPVKGYEEGYYPEGLFPVEREQDGKVFNARYGGKPKSGMVNDPTILVGEMPELIISNPDLKKFNPEVTASIGREIRRVRGYESGYTSPTVRNAGEQDSTVPDNSALLDLVAENITVLRELKETGLTAYLVRDMENAKKIQDDLERLQKYKQKAAI